MKHLRWVAVLAAAAIPLLASASSHREAPNITRLPTVDSTDFYLFNSYEPGREVTSRCSPTTSRCRIRTAGRTISRWIRSALYEIHVDNDGDARENLTFQFRFTNRLGERQPGHQAQHRSERQPATSPCR